MSSDSTTPNVGSEETMKGVDTSRADANLAAETYSSLMEILTREGHTIKNGIIVVRAIEKVFEQWNRLLAGDDFKLGDYIDFAMAAVDSPDARNEHDVYYLTGKAMIAAFEKKTAEVTVRNLRQIEAGVIAVRRSIDDALGYEGKNNDAFDDISAIKAQLIEWEDERNLAQPEDGKGLKLSFPTNKLDILAEVASRAPQLTLTSPPRLPDQAAKGKGRGNRTPGGHVHNPWTDRERLEVLKIWRDHPHASNQWKADEYNRRFPTNIARSSHAVRLQYQQLGTAGTTITGLQDRMVDIIGVGAPAVLTSGSVAQTVTAASADAGDQEAQNEA